MTKSSLRKINQKFIQFKRASLAFIFIATESSAMAALQLSDLKKVIRNSYPDVKISELKKEKAIQDRRSTTGSFDLSWLSEYRELSEGYSNQYLRSTINKPFQFLNLDFFAGYEKGVGEFKPYDGDLVTSDQGGIIFGGDISLLKFALADERRQAFKKATIDVDIADLSLMEEIVTDQFKAAQEYWDWIFAAQRVRVRKNVLDLALKREVFVSEQVRRGSLSGFALKEYQLSVLQRKNDLVQAEGDFAVASQKLSLFLRDDQGRPKMPTIKDVPEMEFSSQNLNRDISLSDAYSRSLTLQKIKYSLSKVEIDYDVAASGALPKLDLKFSYFSDMSSTASSKDAKELKAGVVLDIPLENNTYQGKKQSARREQEALLAQKKFAEEQIEVQVENLRTQLKVAIDRVDLAKNEFEMARWLQDAEMTRFKTGQSNQIFLNIREQDSARAELNLAQAFATAFKTQEAIKALLVEPE